MKFKYYNYEKIELENIKKNSIYISNDFNIKKRLEKKHKNLFKKNLQFITLKKFEEKIYSSNKTLIKEEKEVILFYESLTDKDKKILEIKNYYDCIDIAGNFFKFFNELKNSNIFELKNLNSWQNKKFKTFLKIKNQFEKKLQEKNFINKIEQRKPDLSFLKNYSEIYFINIFEISPLSKKLIKKLNSEFKVHIYLQCKKNDYNEETMKLKKVSIPKKVKTDIKIYSITEPFLQIINLLNIINNNNKKYQILDTNIKNNKYNNIFSQKLIKIEKDIDFTTTFIYQFLNSIYNILRNIEFKKEINIKLIDLINAIKISSFYQYFDINSKDIKRIKLYMERDYKYININLLLKNEEENKKLINILLELKKIYNFKNLNDFCQYLELLDLKKIEDIKKKDDINKYFEALSEIKIIEEIDIVSSWENYFSKNKRSEGLFRLVLKYLKFKKVKNITPEKFEPKAIIEDFYNHSSINSDRKIILNISSGLLPSKRKTEFLLTEKQRKEIGLKTYEDIRLQEKYYFYKEIFSANQVILFSLKNEEKNIDSSPFLEELKLKVNCKFIDNNISQENYKDIIKNIFIDKNLPIINNGKTKKINMEKKDFKNNILNIGSYDRYILNECFYKFYLSRVIGLEKKIYYPEKKLTPKLFGIIAHSAFEKFIDINRKKMMNNNFEIENSQIDTVLKDIIKDVELKLPKKFNKYYKIILFNQIKNGIISFFKILEKEFNNRTIKSLYTEKDDEKNIISNTLKVNIKGRIDLEIQSNDENYLIDYKTGSGNYEQLDFYSILFFDKTNLAKKVIYNIMKEKIEVDRRSDNKILTKDILKEEISKFVNSKTYTRNPKSKSVCNRCEYKIICREGFTDEKDN